MNYFLVLIICILISIIIGYIVRPKNPTWRNTLTNAIFGALIGAIVPTLIYTQYNIKELLELRSDIITQNQLSSLEKQMKLIDNNNPILESYQNYIKRINDELEEAINGIIKLDDEEEVVDEWERIFRDSKSRFVKATNIISPDYWLQESGFSREQLKIQKDAIGNDYTIQRIFIYDISDKNLKQLDSLGIQQKEIGVAVKFLSIDKLRSSPNFMKNNSIIKGTEDFVITDFNLALLTVSNPKTKEINHGYICDNRKIVDTAMEIFDDLWKISENTIK